jgi:hypothetical protein
LLAVSAKILSEPNLVYGDVSKPTFDPSESDETVKKREDDMKKARKAQQSRVDLTLTFGIPVLFALLGIARWRMRLSSRANVSLA